MDVGYVRYIAIAHESPPTASSHLDYELTRRLQAAAAERGLQLISHLYVGRQSWSSTGPVHRLSDYIHAGEEYPIVRSERPAQFKERRRSLATKVMPDP